MCYAHSMERQPEVTEPNLFWDDLARDLEDPQFLREYIIESVRIATIDSIINSLNDARIGAGLSKAALARAIGVEPATVRRLFTASEMNPTLGTLAQVATALGLRITIETLPAVDREALTKPLLTGRASMATARRLVETRRASDRSVAPA
jgi:transcriptional regulator with XRE-family HTH domain